MSSEEAVTDYIVETKSEVQSSWYQKWFGRGKLYEFEVILFGFALVLGNRNFAWNYGLAYGYETVASNTIFVGSAFFCLCLCMSEMSSALPFSGGIFGFVRAASGPYYGFIVSCFEAIFCLANLILMMRFCILIPVVSGYVDMSYTPNLIYIVYGFNLFMNLLGGKPFWILVNIAGFITFVLLLSFLFGTLIDVNKSNVNFKVNCQTNIPATFEAMMQERWLAVSQFQGLQYLPLLSEFTQEPRKSIPRAMVFCAMECITFSLFISLAACSTYPGQRILQLVLTPLMFGFQHIYNIDAFKAMWLHFPGLYAPTITTLYCSGRQLYMIAKSGLLPSLLKLTMPLTGTPAVALLIASASGVSLNLAGYYYPQVSDQIINVIVISSHIVFINAFVAYIFFRKKYSSMPRSFTNPLGVWGAYYGLANNIIGIVAVVNYSTSRNIYYTLYVMIGIFVGATIFYWGFLVKRQTFSDEEKKLMFKAYLINANREKRDRILRNNRVAPCNKSVASVDTKAVTAKSAEDGKQDTPGGSSKAEEASKSEASRLTSRDQYMALRPAEETNPKLHAPSFSEKLMQYVSEKMNAISHEELQEYQQLAVLSAGGRIDPSAEQALEERLGMNDVEQATMN